MATGRHLFAGRLFDAETAFGVCASLDVSWSWALLARGLRPLAPVKPLAANQVRYSLLHRKPEMGGVLDASRRIDVALVAHRPIGSRPSRTMLERYPGGKLWKLNSLFN